MKVSEQALREMVNQVLDGWPSLLWEMGGPNPNPPIKVNSVTDPNAAETDPRHQNYIPQDKVEFTVAIRRLLDSNPDADFKEIYRIVKSELEDCDEGSTIGENKMIANARILAEKVLRKKIRAILNEASPALAANNDGDDNYTPKRRRGSDDEQAKEIIKALKDEFGIDMKASQFQSFDKATKLRWFATAYVSEHDPRFLVRTVAEYIEALEEAADDSGLLDDELIAALKEMEQELLNDPSISDGFSEYLQSEIQATIDSMSPDQFNTFMELAKTAFIDVPGGIMKYTAGGDEKPEDVRTWMGRRQSSRAFTGGGDPATGGGNAADRFAAATSHPNYPPIK